MSIDHDHFYCSVAIYVACNVSIYVIALIQMSVITLSVILCLYVYLFLLQFKNSLLCFYYLLAFTVKGPLLVSS